MFPDICKIFNLVTDPCTLSVDNCLLYSVCQSNHLLASQPQSHAVTLLDVKVLSLNTLEISGSKMWFDMVNWIIGLQTSLVKH